MVTPNPRHFLPAGNRSAWTDGLAFWRKRRVSPPLPGAVLQIAVCFLLPIPHKLLRTFQTPPPRFLLQWRQDRHSVLARNRWRSLYFLSLCILGVVSLIYVRFLGKGKFLFSFVPLGATIAVAIARQVAATVQRSRGSRAVLSPCPSPSSLASARTQ